jgi:hypothetical protein
LGVGEHYHSWFPWWLGHVLGFSCCGGVDGHARK